MIVHTKKLTVKKDARGWVVEVVRAEDVGPHQFGQILLSTAYPGETKGNHYHIRKKEWYCVIRGKGLLTIWQKEGDQKWEQELDADNMILVEIPQRMYHCIKNIGPDTLYLLAYVSEAFNTSDPDTYYE